jgi:hypothetical protein
MDKVQITDRSNTAKDNQRWTSNMIIRSELLLWSIGPTLLTLQTKVLRREISGPKRGEGDNEEHYRRQNVKSSYSPLRIVKVVTSWKQRQAGKVAPLE